MAINLKDLQLAGAKAKLQELQQDIIDLIKRFPGLKGATSKGPPKSVTGKRKPGRRKWTAAQKAEAKEEDEGLP